MATHLPPQHQHGDHARVAGATRCAPHPPHVLGWVARHVEQDHVLHPRAVNAARGTVGAYKHQAVVSAPAAGGGRGQKPPQVLLAPRLHNRGVVGKDLNALVSPQRAVEKVLHGAAGVNLVAEDDRASRALLLEHSEQRGCLASEPGFLVHLGTACIGTGRS